MYRRRTGPGVRRCGVRSTRGRRFRVWDPHVWCEVTCEPHRSEIPNTGTQERGGGRPKDGDYQVWSAWAHLFCPTQTRVYPRDSKDKTFQGRPGVVGRQGRTEMSSLDGPKGESEISNFWGVSSPPPYVRFACLKLTSATTSTTTGFRWARLGARSRIGPVPGASSDVPVGGGTRTTPLLEPKTHRVRPGRSSSRPPHNEGPESGLGTDPSSRRRGLPLHPDGLPRPATSPPVLPPPACPWEVFHGEKFRSRPCR